VIGSVGVEPLLDGPCRHSHRLAARRRFDGLKIPVLDRARAYQRLDLGNDLGLELRFEALFLAASFEVASGVSSSPSAHRSHACQ
jgi:hypothetical protein